MSARQMSLKYRIRCVSSLESRAGDRRRCLREIGEKSRGIRRACRAERRSGGAAERGQQGDICMGESRGFSPSLVRDIAALA